MALALATVALLVQFSQTNKIKHKQHEQSKCLNKYGYLYLG